jgi:tripartite-type tricarboxylate transporter receptor subunit TctC
MPAPLAARIQRDTAALLNSPEMRENLAAQGCIAVGGTPEALTALIRTEYQLWSKVVKAGGVRVE